MLARLRIRTRLVLVLAVPLVAVVGVAVLGLQTMQAVKVDGPSYGEIVEAKDLTQDVVTPPEYLVESFLVVRQLSTETDAGQITRLTDQLTELRATYEQRHAYWQDRLDDQPSLKFALLSDSYAPAQEFWSVVDERFLPAIEAGDRLEAVAIAAGPLQSAYERHHDAVDRVVRLATDRQVQVEADTSALIDWRTRVLVSLVAVVAVVAVALAALVVRSIMRPLRKLEHDLPRVAGELQNLDLTEDEPHVALTDVLGHDELASATQAFNSVVRTAVDLAAEQSRIQRAVSETYLHLGRRNQNLLRRMLSFVTDLEQNERDAETLDHLFRLDHLATRMRRNAESLLVLAGAEPARTWSNPVPMLDVVRAALSEIEDFVRVELADLEPAAVVGTAASDVTHLLAELLENAASFSPPTTRVSVYGRRRDDGYLVSIVDHGIGMVAGQREEAAERLSGGDGAAPAKMLGLHVVGRLAARHDMRVELAANPSGGTVAMVWLPFGVVGPERGDASLPVVAPDESEREPALIGAPPSKPVVTPDEPPVVRLPHLAPPEDSGLRPRPRPRGSVPHPAPAVGPTSTGPARSADEVRSNLARLQAGVRQARHDRPQRPPSGGGPR